MKTLTLTKEEIKALEMVGYRYNLGKDLLDSLIGDWQLQNTGKEYDQAVEGFTVELYLDSRKALGDDLLSDCERLESGRLIHPMLSREFVNKLVDVAYFDLEY